MQVCQGGKRGASNPMQKGASRPTQSVASTANGEGLSDVLLHAGLKRIWKLGKATMKDLLKSDMTRRAAAKYIKNMPGRMIDQVSVRVLITRREKYQQGGAV